MGSVLVKFTHDMNDVLATPIKKEKLQAITSSMVKKKALRPNVSVIKDFFQFWHIIGQDFTMILEFVKNVGFPMYRSRSNNFVSKGWG